MIARKIKRQPQCRRGLDEWLARGEHRTEHEPVHEARDATEQHTHAYASQFGHHDVLLINSQERKAPRAPIAP